MRNVEGPVQSACDVCCKAVGWMQRSHVPQQQSGLIVGFAIYLWRKKYVDITCLC